MTTPTISGNDLFLTPSTPAPAVIADDSMERVLLQEIRRSNVRVYITYIMTWAYVVAIAAVLYASLKGVEVSDLALGILAGLSSASLGIIGFWFGGRATGVPEGLTNAMSILANLRTNASTNTEEARKDLWTIVPESVASRASDVGRDVTNSRRVTDNYPELVQRIQKLDTPLPTQ